MVHICLRLMQLRYMHLRLSCETRAIDTINCFDVSERLQFDTAYIRDKMFENGLYLMPPLHRIIGAIGKHSTEDAIQILGVFGFVTVTA